MRLFAGTRNKVLLVILVVAAVFLPMLAQPQHLLGDDLAYLAWHAYGSPVMHRLFLKAYLNLVFPVFQHDGRYYLLVDFFVHCLNALLLFLFARRLAGRGDVALIAALLFALHDASADATLHTVYICELFATGFSLLALLVFTYFKESVERAGSARRRGILYGLSLASFLCALLSRATAIGLPLVILAYDSFWGRPAEKKRALLLRSAPFFLLSFAFAAISLQHPLADNAPFKLAQLLSDPGGVIAKFPRALLYLFSLYRFPAASARLAGGAAQGALIVLFFFVCFFILFFRSHNRAARFGVWWLFFSVFSISVTSGVVLYAKDFYGPLAAASFVLAWFVVACAEKLGGAHGRRSGFLVAAFACALFIPLALSMQHRQSARTAAGALVRREVDFVLQRLETGYSRRAIVYALDFPAYLREGLAYSGHLERYLFGPRYKGRWARLFFVNLDPKKSPDATTAYALTMSGAPPVAQLPFHKESLYYTGRGAGFIPPDGIDMLFAKSLPRAVFVFREGKVFDLTQEYLPRAETAFRVQAPAATDVRLIGDFNDWDANAHPLVRQPDGRWMTTVRLFPNVYRYQFLVDGGQAMPDPENPRRSFQPGRGECSVLAVINPALPAGLLPTGDRKKDREIVRAKECSALYPRSASIHLALASLLRRSGFSLEAKLEMEMAQRLRAKRR